MPLLTNFQHPSELVHLARSFEGFIVQRYPQLAPLSANEDTMPPGDLFQRLLDDYEGALRSDTVGRVNRFFMRAKECEAYAYEHQNAASETQKWLPANGRPDAQRFRDWLNDNWTGTQEATLWGAVERLWDKEAEHLDNNNEVWDPSRIPNFFYLLSCLKELYDNLRMSGRTIWTR